MAGVRVVQLRRLQALSEGHHQIGIGTGGALLSPEAGSDVPHRSCHQYGSSHGTTTPPLKWCRVGLGPQPRVPIAGMVGW